MKRLMREAVETVILALLIFLGLQFSVQNFRVEGSSMDPTLEPGQYVLVNKLVYLHLRPGDIDKVIPFVSLEGSGVMFPFHPPNRGEVIVFEAPQDPSRNFVKRVVAIPGDTIEMRKGQVYINGSAIEEPYITHPDSYTMPPLKIPRGSFFVLGDNRRASNDSRAWGPVPLDNIVGRAWFSYWPLNRWEFLQSFLWLYP